MSTYTIGQVLHASGYRWLAARSWCETGRAVRKRRAGTVKVTDPDSEAKKRAQWQRGLKNRITLPALLPRLRLLLVWDNLKEHLTPALVLWLFAHGVMPPYTPLSGSWLNMAESIQRIIGRRALAGQYLQTWVPLKVQCPGWRLHCATSATPLRFPPSKKYANACGKRLVVQLV